MIPKRTQLARQLRHDQTSAEALLWEQLRDRRLMGLKFRRQFPIAGFIVDFCCPECRLTVELDGKHHDERMQRDRDRRDIIAAHGYCELRFSNDEVKERLDWVLREIERMVDIAKGHQPRAAFPRFVP